MTTPTIHGPALSTYVRTARMVCEEKAIPYALNEVGFGTPELKALHPFEKVPAFSHGDLSLYETAAICLYLDETFPGPTLTPADVVGRARMVQWISATNAYHYPRIIPPIVLPRFGFAPLDEARVAEAAGPAEAALAVADAALAKSRWLAGDAMTIADLLLPPILFYFAMVPEGKAAMAGKANLQRHYDAVAARESWKKTEPKLPG
ncbi:MAG: glutathione S-transferase family protein [Alphaproteobacteria bacterium]